ncbi:MAG TPA: hypothetical protein VFW50_02965 [Streptosporangiaceae bacterium]|nr:hypothetical protein [Streptosporangiaceae bacterium]
MNGTALIIGFTTGMLFTRRVGPLGGAGLLALILPLTIWSSGAPLAVAITGVFAYQALFFWLLMPIALACWPSSSVHREIYGGKSPSCLITG